MNESYKKIGYLFEKVDEHLADNKSRMIKSPGKDEDGVFTYGTSLKTMKDGRQLEFCMWCEPEMDMALWDISMEKEGSGFKDTAEYLEYLSGVGFYLENVEDKYGKWYYGVIPNEKFFRIQYAEMS